MVNAATALMNSGTQWVSWAFDAMDVMVVAQCYRGDPSAARGGLRPQDLMEPAFPEEPSKLSAFIQWLSETHRKVRMDFITHNLSCAKDGTWSIKPKDAAVLQTACDPEQRKTRKFNLNNVAGLVDVQKFKDSNSERKVNLYHTLHYWEKTNRILGDYPRIRATRSYTFKQGCFYELM